MRLKTAGRVANSTDLNPTLCAKSSGFGSILTVLFAQASLSENLGQK